MISEDDVRRIAALAKLELADDELARMQRDLVRILEFVDQIAPGARSGAQSAPFPGAGDSGAQAAPLRVDDPRPSLDAADVAANAPQFLAAHFVVPRILGGGE